MSKEKKYEIVGSLDYVQGYLRTGDLVLTLTEEQYQTFKAMSEEEQVSYLDEVGDVEVSDWSIDGRGDIQSIHVTEI